MEHLMNTLIALVVLVFVLPFAAGAFSAYRANKRAFSAFVRVVDGDTVAIGAKRFRIQGIDAPEMDTPAGQQATDALLDLIGQQPVRLVPFGTDRYGRTLVKALRADGQDLAKLMIRAGHARRWN
jgi:endonuclease YncB( thermonuclease family)